MSFFGEVLAKLGWDDGFQVPVANSENQALEAELIQLSLRKLKAKNAFEGVNSKLHNISDHFKYVNQENEQTQKLIVAHKQRFDSEEHQYHVVKAEKNKTENDIGQTKKQIELLEQRKEVQKNELKKAVIKVDKIKSETGWDIEALKAWEESLKKRDEDNEIIKKFSREDERRFNELEAKRQNLQTEYDAKTATVHKLVQELHSNEMIIEKTGKAIKQQYAEREVLIRQWKDAVKMLQQRDNDISKEQQSIIDAHDELEKLQERLNEENDFLKNQIKSNRDVELQIQKFNNIYSRMKRDMEELAQRHFLVANEVYTLKRTVASAAQELETERMKGRLLTEEIERKDILCEKSQDEKVQLENKIKEMRGCSDTSAEKVERIRKMIEIEERRINIYRTDTDKINACLYRLDQMLKFHITEGKNTSMEINNVSCICTKLKKHIRDKKKDLESLKEVVYDMEFRINEFEEKLSKLEDANKNEDHSDEREDKIRDLEKVLAEHTEVQQTLQSQVDKLQEEMRRLSNFITSDKDHLEVLQNKVENHLLIYEIGRKQIAAAKNSTQEKQVEENMMRLRVNHIEGDMENENKKIFNLQRLRLKLDQAMKERQLDVDTKKAVVLAKKRSLEEDVGRLRGDIVLRANKLEHYQKKYHIELMSLGKDEDGQTLSLTHFKIRSAQERFFLQQQGDELDTKIKKAEKEIIAMENTLKVVNLTNATFKSNLIQLKEDDQEVQEMKSLEAELKDRMIKLKRAKDVLATQQSDLNETKGKLEEVIDHQASLKENEARLEEENLLVYKQEHDKEEKLQRAETRLKQVIKKLGKRSTTVYDRDLEIRHLKDINRQVQKKLTSMGAEFPEMAPLIRRYVGEQDLAISPSSSCSSFYSIWSGSCHKSSVGDISPINCNKVNITLK